MAKKVLTIITVYTDGTCTSTTPDKKKVKSADDPIGGTGDGDNDADDNGGNNPVEPPDDPQ
jgi:hypothetical protein